MMESSIMGMINMEEKGGSVRILARTVACQICKICIVGIFL